MKPEVLFVHKNLPHPHVLAILKYRQTIYTLLLNLRSIIDTMETNRAVMEARGGADDVHCLLLRDN
jgi:hypothetical protein